MKPAQTTHSKTARIDIPILDPEICVLALESLSKLTTQLTSEKSLDENLKVFLWTLSGQMSCPNTFIVVKSPKNPAAEFLYFGTGGFDTSTRIKLIDWEAQDFRYFSKKPGAHSVSRLERLESCRTLASELGQAGVELVCPLSYDDVAIGMIGLGSRIGHKPYAGQDAALLVTLANTLTPFIVNSMLYEEMAGLVKWQSAVFNSVKHGLLVLGSDLRLRIANAAAESMLKELNPTFAHVKSLEGASLNLVFPNDVFTGWNERLVEASKRDEATSLTNMLARSGDEERVFNVGVVRTQEISDQGYDTIITFEDISIQKSSERRMIDLHRMADKGLMASSIAHELNNFVGMILGGVQLARTACQKNNRSALEKYLEQLEAAVHKTQRYTAGITDFGRVESSIKRDSLNDIVREVLSFARVQSRFTRIDVRHDLDPNIPEFEMDRDQVAQLLLNLSNNSADAIRECGRPDGNILVTTRLTEQGIELAVRDNGIGMQPEVKEKLFSDRFTTKASGHGFGLFNCAKIAESHNAKIRVESEVSVGTTIALTFPLS